MRPPPGGKVPRQIVALTLKNFLIFYKTPIVTFLRALFFPIATAIVLIFCKDIFKTQSFVDLFPGIATSALPLRDLSSAIEAGQKLVFARNGLGSANVDPIINSVLSAPGISNTPHVIVDSLSELFDVCPQTLDGTSECFAAVVFTAVNATNVDYTIVIDGAENDINGQYKTHTSLVNDRLMPLQWAINSHIGSFSTAPKPLELPYSGNFMLDSTQFYSGTSGSTTPNPWYGYIAVFVAPVFMLIFMGVVYHMALFVATERGSGMSELLAAQTCTTTPRMLSTYLSFAALYGPGWIIAGAMIGALLFKHSSAILVVFMHILAGLSVTATTHLVASFFRKAQLAGLWTSVLFFALAFVGIANFLDAAPSFTVVYALTAIFPPITYATMISDMARDEGKLLTFSLTKGSDSIDPESNQWDLYPQMAGYYFIVFFLLQIFVYGVAAYGVEKWLWGVKRKFTKIEGKSDTAVRCTGFSKTFKAKGGPNKAVDGLNLELKRSSITFLLGPNGGGKTTTLKCIAGMTAADKGSLLEINENDMDFGVCPQGNVFWENLSVAEHLRIWTRIKTASSNQSNYDEDVLVECDLLEKRNSPAKTLSGGQMRKLQLAIAFVGGSKMCFIDEATSGLDPLSRQTIWTIIAKGHSKRTVLMTTHFLDEADILADHIAIVYQGKLVCAGSSTALKATYGNKFTVNALQSDNSDDLPQSWHMTSSSEATAKVLELEQSTDSSYSVDFPTLDQVFLKVTNAEMHAHGDEKFEEKARTTTGIEEDSDELPITQKHVELEVGKSAGFLRQIVVILKKRYLLLQRNWFSFLIAVATPVIIAAVLNHFMPAITPFKSCSINRESMLGGSPLDVVMYGNLGDWKPSSVLGPASAFSGAVQDAVYRQSVRDIFKAPYGSVDPDLAQLALTSRDLNATSLTELVAIIGANRGAVGFGIFDDNGNTTLVHSFNPVLTLTGLDVITNRLANATATSAAPARIVTTKYQLFRHAATRVDYRALPLSVLIVLGFITTGSIAVIYPVFERVNNVRSLQYCNGVSPAALWIAYLIFEMQIAIVTSVVTWCLVFGTGTAADTWFEPNYILGVLILFCLATYLGVFVISHFIKKGAFAIAIGLHLLLFVLYLVGYVVNQAAGVPNNKGQVYLALQAAVGLTSPAANLARTLFIAINQFDVTCGTTGYEIISPGSFALYGGVYCNLIIQIVFLAMVLALIEYGSSEWFVSMFRRRRDAVANDLAESRGIDGIEMKTLVSKAGQMPTLNVSHISKSFGKNTATSDVSFSIASGTTLGLLGPNGAGKTTTINMIRGLIKPDSGVIHINGVDVAMHPQQARMHMGVCPQDDAIDELNVRQTLEFFAAMKGLRDVEGESTKLLRALGIERFASVRVKKLSGGTRRKLMVGVSLLGNPSVLLLDEPSTGQDAGAKRVLWEILKSFQASRAILLTTHSMEEAEALASHVAILGTRMLASGSLPQLRSQYGGSYRIRGTYDVRVPASTVEARIRSQFGDSVSRLTIAFGEVDFEVPHETRKLGHTLMTMEDMKGAGVLMDYTVSEPDMNEVFMSVCRQAKLRPL